jgi:hypothetical protein
MPYFSKEAAIAGAAREAGAHSPTAASLSQLAERGAMAISCSAVRPAAGFAAAGAAGAADGSTETTGAAGA